MIVTPAGPIVTPTGMHPKAPLHGKGQAVVRWVGAAQWVAVECPCGSIRHRTAYSAAHLKSHLCGRCAALARAERKRMGA